MLDFRSGSAKFSSTRGPYYKQNVDSGRLLMMVISSVLLLGLIFTLGRPPSQPPASGPGGSVEGASDQLSPGSRVTLIGGAILGAALCVVACVMFVLYRMAGPGRVNFAVRDAVETPPDF